MMTDIHPNMPPISLPWITVWDWGLGVAFVVLVLAILGRWWITRPKPEPKKPPVSPPLPSQDIVRKLQKLITAEDWKTFCTDSSAAFKSIVSAQYQTDLAEKTTEEIIVWSKKSHVKQQTEIKRFFALVDPIKYAGLIGQRDWAEQALEIFKTFYRTTK